MKNWMDFVTYLNLVKLSKIDTSLYSITDVNRSGELLKQFIVTHKVEINKFLENKE